MQLFLVTVRFSSFYSIKFEKHAESLDALLVSLGQSQNDNEGISRIRFRDDSQQQHRTLRPDRIIVDVIEFPPK